MAKIKESSSISIEIDPEKLRALRQFMDKKELTVEDELTATIQKIYEKYVPLQVREFIENAEESTLNRNPKILQDKGVMPKERQNAKETPIGNANRLQSNDITNENMT